MENLHGRLKVVIGERHHIGVGSVTENNRLLLQCPLERTEIVTQAGGALEVQFLCRGIHLTFQVPGETVGPAGEEVAEIPHDRPVLLGTDPANAGSRAFVDIAQQTGAFDLTVPLEDSGRTGTGGKDPGQQVEGFADGPGVGVRTEVAHAFAARTAVDGEPGEFLIECHRQHRVGLVIAVTHVEPGIELLDPVVLELQRLDFGGDHRPLDLGRGGDHLPGPGVQAGDIGEIRRQATPQTLGLAHVDDPAVHIGEPVDTRFDGNGSGRRAIRRGIGHPLRLVRPVAGHQVADGVHRRNRVFAVD